MSITCRTDTSGTKFWYKNGNIHRDGDLPAIEYITGSKQWYKDGKLDRDGGLPACEYVNGDKYWFENGLRHRNGDLPAIELADGYKCWYKNGTMHRDGDLPAIEYNNKLKNWYKYDRYYGQEVIEKSYKILQNQCRRFRGYLWRKKLRYKSSIHKELLCRPARGNFPGGLHYQEMVESL